MEPSFFVYTGSGQRIPEDSSARCFSAGKVFCLEESFLEGHGTEREPEECRGMTGSCYMESLQGGRL